MLTVPGFALITGAASGIGRATALAFARAGAAGIHLADRNSVQLLDAIDEVKSAATNPDFKTSMSGTDIADAQQVDTMVSTAMKAFGRLDYAANIAGVLETSHPTAELPIEEYDSVMQINSRGAFLCMRAELAAMRAQQAVARLPSRPAVRGSITNMGSILGHIALPTFTSYVTAKHSVLGMTKAAAATHAQEGIRVNAVCPGWVETELSKNSAGATKEWESILAAVPMRRMASCEEVADVVLFIASEYASYVNGAAWTIDGGRTVV
ncbi:3-oxoacyl-reductase [Cylindrobasidium torrendii FP15055 ss-10]|uniref:3-oxoacyl-reductase n=1 Tax=Cylindrobasidium torrendii FP15055 ss-10 TaxID=1314674 RepID=A0A0D7B2Q3_9AGAR|nr:3-oxoacyl-reductase [Cylindrobasidium torrendii FP15055 ss-10]